ncbi:MAG: hypothetical protein K6G58_07190 [Lachnospiraceae bacterium]|nr:hypothetical protein [Lachnospiraceae bacterium]
MKRSVFAMALILSLACLAGCANFTSQNYSAVGFVHGNTDTSAYMDFKRFKGNMNFRLEASEGDRLRCSASLEEGSAVIYRITDGEKEELFSVSAGEDIDSSFDADAGDVYLEFVAVNACEGGRINFEIEEEL